LIKLIEIHETSKGHILREVYVSPKHVVSLREDMRFRQKLEEGQLPSELDDTHLFTRLTLDKGFTGLEIVVVGAPALIESKLKSPQKELLHG